MKVSVIIPVYNAAAYVAQAVESALAQPEVVEVLLVEDGSPDRSLAVCERLARETLKVRLLRHPDGANRGAGASRNLGIQHSRCDCVAFLDADDYYLPNRFAHAQAILDGEPAVDGVCETMSTHFMSDDARRQWLALGHGLATGLRAGIPAERIFEEQSPMGQSGHCHVNAVTLRRRVFSRCGGFPDLDLVEDTAFFMKLAACANLRVAHDCRPVAMRRVHASNRVTQWQSPSRVWRGRRDVYLNVLHWLRTTRPPRATERVKLIQSKMLWDMQNLVRHDSATLARRVVLVCRLAGLVFHEPRLLAHANFTRIVLRNVLRSS